MIVRIHKGPSLFTGGIDPDEHEFMEKVGHYDDHRAMHTRQRLDTDFMLTARGHGGSMKAVQAEIDVDKAAGRVKQRRMYGRPGYVYLVKDDPPDDAKAML